MKRILKKQSRAEFLSIFLADKSATTLAIAAALEISNSSAATLLAEYATRGIVVRAGMVGRFQLWGLPASVPVMASLSVNDRLNGRADEFVRDQDALAPVVRAW